MKTDSVASERIVVTRREQLELLAWSAPAPAPGQIRVRVAFSAVSFGDVMLRRHVFRRRPAVAVPGYEVVGQVEAVGVGVRDLQLGDRVAAFVEYGGNARHALVHAEDAVVLPAAIDEAQAAAIVLNYATAFGMLEAARLVEGERFLIHGATGGVGSAVLDVARALGLLAIGTTRASTVPQLFGAPLLNARSRTLVSDVLAASGGGVRAVFDSRAGRGLWKSRAMLARGGSLIVFGLSTLAERSMRAALGTVGTLVSLALFGMMPSKRRAVFAIDKIYRRDPARIRAWLARALDLLAAGKLSPAIGATLPLAQVAQAQHMVETGAVLGKVVIDCR